MDVKDYSMDSQSPTNNPDAGSQCNTNLISPIASNADTSYDTYQRTSECLRKLREDITLFRDPKVRTHFSAVSVQESLSPGLLTPSSEADDSSEIVAKQHAAIVSLRTTIAELESSLTELKTSDLNTRKRAARAEGQLAELQTQQKAQELAHHAAIDEATSRIRGLENDSASNSKTAADERARLAQKVEELQLEVDEASKALGKAESNTVAATARLHALEAEHRASKATHDYEKRMLQNDKRDACEKENTMRKEIERIRALRGSSLQGDNQSADSQKRLVEKVQLENLQLKSELQWLSSKATRTDSELREAESANQKLREELHVVANTTSEVGQLRKKISMLEVCEGDATDAKKAVNALRREKEEIRKIISMLSRSGDVAEGLSILKKMVQNNRTAIGELPIPKSLGNSDPMETELPLENVEESEKTCRSLQEELAACKKELNGRITSESVSEHIRRMLHREIDVLKMALNESQCRLGGKDVHSTAEVATLEKQMKASRALLNEYHGVIGKLETVLQNKEKENKQFQNIPNLVLEKGENPLSVDRAKNLEDDLIAFRQKARVLETEIEELTLKQEGIGEKEEREGEPDYDSKVFKVVHMSENPLSRAISRWKQEQEKMKGKKRMRISASPLRGIATKEEVENVRSEMVKMKEEYDDLKRKAVLGDRTRQVALKRIEEVRCAVYNLFGWSMKVNGAVYALSSIYAESPMEVLHFCINEEGGMSLVDSEYAQGLSQELEQYVERMNSFPALLSHITMANFEKTTAFMT